MHRSSPLETNEKTPIITHQSDIEMINVEGQFDNRNFRLVDRNGVFHQSTGDVKIVRNIPKYVWKYLYLHDAFHSLVDMPTLRMISILITTYLSFVFAYSIIYYAVWNRWGCNLEFKSFIDAYFLTLETMATIGYSTYDIFFGDCVVVAVLLTSQMCLKLMTDALIIGLIYCRISRPSQRASSILFSNQAIITNVRGKLYFTIRCCELRHHQLLACNVRCYAIRSNRDDSSGEEYPFCTIQMRLSHPNDSYGSSLLLCFPQEIVHEIDAWSPLMPPPQWASKHGIYNWQPPAFEFARSKSEHGSYPSPPLRNPVNGHAPSTSSSFGPSLPQDWTSTSPPNSTSHSFTSSSSTAASKHKMYASVYNNDMCSFYPDIRRRSVDYEITSCFRSHLSVPTPTLVSTFYPYTNSGNVITVTNGSRHFYSSLSDVEDGRGRDVSRSIVHESHTTTYENTNEMERKLIDAYLLDRNIEIVVVIEGQDSLTGGIVQAKHSYKFNEIVWNGRFVNCVKYENENAVVDYNIFHDIKIFD